MKIKSRREFVKSCVCLALTAVPCVRGLFLPGCGDGRNATRRQNEISDAQAEGVQERSTAAIDPKFEAGYLKLHKTGELKRRGEKLWKVMEECRLCPRECGANRLKGERGLCQASSQLEIASYHPHFGEERPLVGTGGSGTIFFTNCSLRCVFCINWEISQGGEGTARSVEEFANMMLDLQRRGCHNINIVTPTHYPAHILLALDIAAAKGLRLPLVYNTCGWERLDVLKVLDGVVDIYLPDFKYARSEMASKYSSGADTYAEFTKSALLEMHRQVGVARPARDGLMYRGLMIRHLVMPNDVSGTKEVIEWIASNLPKDTYLNIMSQYRPMYKAFDYPEIARRLTHEEYANAVRWAREAGLTNLDAQGWPF
ncbi:MAG: radical SAM protein [Ignavibacteria bacterium]|nr:radical SAM protein [Ignavibacteria bacterium]